MECLGIVAGNGSLPVRLAEAALAQGLSVAVTAVGDSVDDRLEALATHYQVLGAGMLEAVISSMKDCGVRRLVWAGKVSKDGLFKGMLLDARFQRLLARLSDTNDDTLLSALAEEFEAEGISLDDQTLLLQPLMPARGVLSQSPPSAAEWADIAFGFGRAKHLGGLDIGQTVVVKRGAVLAVEAIEGTDACVRRGGLLGRGGATVVKVAKPNQDLRFDVPTVGLETVRAMVETGVRVLAIEASRTFLLDRDEMLELADANGVAVVVTDEAEMAGASGEAKDL